MLRRTISDVGEPRMGPNGRPVPTLGGFARTLMNRVSTGKVKKDEDSECDMSPNSIRQLLFFPTRTTSVGVAIPKDNLSPPLSNTEMERSDVNGTRDSSSIFEEVPKEMSRKFPASDGLADRNVLGVSGQVPLRPLAADGLRRPQRQDTAAKWEGQSPVEHSSENVRPVLVETDPNLVMKQKPTAVSEGMSELAHRIEDGSVRETVDPIPVTVSRRSPHLPAVVETTESPKTVTSTPMTEDKYTPRGRDMLKPAKSESFISIHNNSSHVADQKAPKKSPPLVLHGEPESGYKCAVRIPNNPTPRRSGQPPTNVTTSVGLPPKSTVSKSTENYFSLPSRRGRVKGIDHEALKHVGESAGDIINGTVKNARESKPTGSEDWDIQTEGVQCKKYMLVRPLGKGGSGEVFLVVEKETKNLFALKKVNLAGLNGSILDECVNEIKMLTGLKDSNFVVRIDTWEINRAQNMMKIVMEYGQCDLAVSLKTSKFSLRQVQATWESMLKIVAEIHHRGIVHSDLKPSNFVWVGHQLKIIDFGIASRIQTDSTSIDILNPKGTLNYISPETISPSSTGKAKVGPKSDIWSLGCILYLMVYGKTPFQEYEHYAAKIGAIVRGEISYPPLPMEFQGSCVDSVLALCFRMDHHQRPTASDLLRHPFLLNRPLTS